MGNYKFYRFSFLIIYLFLGCNSSKKFYSYEVKNYRTDSTKHFLFSNRYISCDEYLIEFNITENNQVESYIESGVTKAITKFDTTSLYLISAKKQLVYEFDSFSIKSKLLNIKKLSEKTNGFSISHSSDSSNINNEISYSDPIDTIINYQKYFYSQVFPKEKNGEDSVEEKIILVKNKNFNSIYKANGMLFRNPVYCIIGIDFFLKKHKQGFISEINDLRILTQSEKEICEKIIRITENNH